MNHSNFHREILFFIAECLAFNQALAVARKRALGLCHQLVVGETLRRRALEQVSPRAVLPQGAAGLKGRPGEFANAGNGGRIWKNMEKIWKNMEKYGRYRESAYSLQFLTI